MRGLGHLPQPLLGRVCLLLTHTFPSPARCFYLTVHTSASCAPAARQLVCLTRGRLPPSLPTPTSAPTGARERLWDVLCLQMCSFCSREAGACSFVAFLNCQCSSFFVQQLTQSLNPVSSRTFLDVFFFLCCVAGTCQCFLDPDFALLRIVPPSFDVCGPIIQSPLNCSVPLLAVFSGIESLWGVMRSLAEFWRIVPKL